MPLGKIKPLPLLATNEPAISNWALGPNKIPLGLTKYKLALPDTPNVPKMLEGLLPVTRLKILITSAGLEK